MKRFLIIILVSLLCLPLIGCSAENHVIKASKEKEDSTYDNVIASIPDEKVTLYIKSKEQYEPIQEMMLDIDGNRKLYKWNNVNQPGHLPQMLLEDINKDGNKELIIILTTGYGSDIHREAVHVIDPKNFEEELVENPFENLAQKVAVNKSEENGNIKFIIKIGDKTDIITKKVNESIWFDKISLDSAVYYYVKNNKLYVSVEVRVSPTISIGNIVMEYTFKDGKYEITSIVFQASQ